ncbi:hypothetical protein EV582_0228 [Duganella sp. BK701]|nr:hypothetical protein EV582_0228 [Duganella sp. BK701]
MDYVGAEEQRDAQTRLKGGLLQFSAELYPRTSQQRAHPPCPNFCDLERGALSCFRLGIDIGIDGTGRGAHIVRI